MIWIAQLAKSTIRVNNNNGVKVQIHIKLDASYGICSDQYFL